jgi:hypothetical protein
MRQLLSNDLAHISFDPVAGHSVSDPLADREGKAAVIMLSAQFAQDQPPVPPRLACCPDCSDAIACFEPVFLF